jgi:uncharacterized protein
MSTNTDHTVNKQAAAQHAVREHFRLVSSGQIEDWLDLFTPDGLIEFPFAPTGMPTQVQGREGLRAHMNSFPETFDVDFVNLKFHETTDPNLVIAECNSVGRAVPTGKPYEQTVIAIVYTDDNGRITRFRDFWNPLVAIEALTPDEASVGKGVAASFGS